MLGLRVLLYFSRDLGLPLFIVIIRIAFIINCAIKSISVDSNLRFPGPPTRILYQMPEKIEMKCISGHNIEISNNVIFPCRDDITAKEANRD